VKNKSPEDADRAKAPIEAAIPAIPHCCVFYRN
jgi:hypothetical protein